MSAENLDRSTAKEQAVQERESDGIRARAVSHAACSALVPGLGQLVQRRFGAAAMQFGTVAAYAALAIGSGNARGLWIAAAWNVWSAVDAYRRERD